MDTHIHDLGLIPTVWDSLRGLGRVGERGGGHGEGVGGVGA